MSTSHKQAFIRYLAKKNRRPQHFYHTALTEIFDGIQDQLKEGKRIHFLGFGTFYTRVIKFHKGINPKTKEKIEVPENRYPAFKVGDVLTRAVRKKKLPEKKGVFSRLTSLGRQKATKK